MNLYGLLALYVTFVVTAVFVGIEVAPIACLFVTLLLIMFGWPWGYRKK